ncbi:MAG: mechanosensitive ion channel, partial [Thermoplasmata archaeon]|nr:mechanosensitive ion channel [Thermoplasmata archaeon]
MKFRNLAIILLTVIMLSLSFSAMLPTASASPGDMHIFEPTVSTMEVKMDSSAIYLWGVYNNGTTPHTLLIDINGDDFGWEAHLAEGDSYFVLNPGEFHSIELNVTAPKTRDYPENTIHLTGTVRDLVTEEQWERDMGNVTTTIVGGAYVPPTKVLGWFDDPLGNYIPALNNEWGVFITTVLLWLIIGSIIYFVLDPVVKQFTKRTDTDLDDKILAIVKGPVFGLIIAYGIVTSLEVLNFSWSVVNALEIVYSLLFIFLICWMAFKIFKDVLLSWGKAYAEKSETTLDDVMLPLFEKMGMILIVGIAIISVLNLFGVDVTLLLAGMGVIGLVIAFAAQDTLGNFISGIFLLTDRPFKVGDLVLMENGDYCRVEHIGMRSTTL